MCTDPGHICTATEDTHLQIFRGTSSPITVPLEVEPQLEDVVVKLTPKSPLVWIFPLAVYDLESNILHTNSNYSLLTVTLIATVILLENKWWGCWKWLHTTNTLH